jgi:hypothetical protein
MEYNNKIQKCINLTNEIKQQWHMEQVALVPIVLSATDGAIDTAQELELLNLKEGIYNNIQRAAVLIT